MLMNYLLTAWRHVIGNRLFSAINIFGLSVGLTSCILIMLFVQDELAYDQWIPDADNTVRMHTGFVAPDRPPFLTVRSAGRMMQAISDFAPAQVKTGVRLLQLPATVIHQEQAFNQGVIFADGTFFDVFQLPFVHGDPAAAFNKPMDLVITEEMAIRYFGKTDVVGQTITLCCVDGERLEAQVTGVLADLPEQTHLDLEFLAYLEPSLFDFAPNMLNTWTSVNTYTYFKLQSGATPQSLREAANDWLDNHSPLREMVEEGVTPSDRLRLNFMPVSDLHLHARADAGNLGDFKALGDINMIFAFAGVAILVLMIASINFMNLATARASMRSREVALRKVMGASRGQVARQFVGEAVAIALLSLLFALVLVELMLPFYSDAIDRSLQFDLYSEPLTLAMILAVAIFVGILSGSYPALYLSRFLPARILKGQNGADSSRAGVRSLLVVFQFSVSIGLAICTLVVYGQTLYARSMDVGYSYDAKIVLSGLNAAAARDRKDAIVNELKRLEGVRSVALSSEVPSQDNENNTGFTLLDGANNDALILNYYTAGYGFFDTYDMQLVAGRGFDEQFGTDAVQMIPEGEDRIGRASVVINESAARQLGFADPAQAVGKTLRANVFRAGVHDLEIVGVARDVYFRSIKFGIRPSVFIHNPTMLQVATISYSTTDVRGLIEDIEDLWRNMVPDTPVSHQFLSDMVHAQYRAEERQARLFAAFSLLAIVIACLGLYGLASFTAERRTREIGIRKVMGARIRDIVRLLIWQFSVPVIVANVIAWPIAWYLMSSWLDGFSYRLDLSFVLLASLITGTAALIIAWLTVASRAIKVASANPIAALRYE